MQTLYMCPVVLVHLHLLVHFFVGFKNYLLLIYVYKFCLHVWKCTACRQCPWRPEEGIVASGTGVTYDW